MNCSDLQHVWSSSWNIQINLCYFSKLRGNIEVASLHNAFVNLSLVNDGGNEVGIASDSKFFLEIDKGNILHPNVPWVLSLLLNF